MKLTKPGQLRSFAAYPRCWADLIPGQHRAGLPRVDAVQDNDTDGGACNARTRRLWHRGIGPEVESYGELVHRSTRGRPVAPPWNAYATFLGGFSERRSTDAGVAAMPRPDRPEVGAPRHALEGGVVEGHQEKQA